MRAGEGIATSGRAVLSRATPRKRCQAESQAIREPRPEGRAAGYRATRRHLTRSLAQAPGCREVSSSRILLRLFRSSRLSIGVESFEPVAHLSAPIDGPEAGLTGVSPQGPATACTAQASVREGNRSDR